MEKTIIYCDRCMKECNGLRKNYGYNILRVRDDSTLDLCQECYDEFRDWINSAKEYPKESEVRE